MSFHHRFISSFQAFCGSGRCTFFCITVHAKPFAQSVPQNQEQDAPQASPIVKRAALLWSMSMQPG